MDLIVNVIKIIETCLSIIKGLKNNDDRKQTITITNNITVYNNSSEK